MHDFPFKSAWVVRHRESCLLLPIVRYHLSEFGSIRANDWAWSCHWSKIGWGVLRQSILHPQIRRRNFSKHETANRMRPNAAATVGRLLKAEHCQMTILILYIFIICINLKKNTHGKCTRSTRNLRQRNYVTVRRIRWSIYAFYLIISNLTFNVAG